MSGFLTDTLVWTGALLALVLLVRRPVAQVFGAKAAYALWALPMARLALPPLVLPSWMAPAPAAPVPEVSALAPEALEPVATMTFVAPPFESVAANPGIDWAGLLLAVWLAGATVFLVRRYALYFRMRREFLFEARPVGEVGSIRLVETPQADGPVAFGVLDKVIALPVGFMASRDIAARDLALLHELAHHRGHDLLCNMLVQPLFAIHWFNPLAMLGWNALRRDQEAACDARVVGDAPREQRAAYAAVIARFATRTGATSRLALAAPMACPVLGDRSIVQRLKCLGMSDLSSRRRLAGRMLIGASALALPLTGSISYAHVSPPAAPLPPTAPAASAAPEAPAAPPPPTLPPAAAAAPDGKHRIVRIERIVGDDGKVTERRYVRVGGDMTAGERAEMERGLADMREEIRDAAHDREEADREWKQDQIELQREMRETFRENGEVEREVRMAIAEAGLARAEALAEAGRARSYALSEAGRARSEAMAQARASMAAAPRVTVRCRAGQKDVTETFTGRDGRENIFICKSLATREATRALAAARAEIARSRDMSASERAEALRSLDEAEREIRKD